MKHRKLGATLLCLSYALTVSTFFMSPYADARVGGGRSFGNRGSRGFSTPSYSGNRGYSGSPYSSQPRSSGQYSNSNPSPGNSAPYNTQRPYQAPSTTSSFLKTMGAGTAGGVIGNMLFRSLGMGGGGGGGVGPNYGLGGSGSGLSGGGGFGVIEFLLLLGLIFLLFKIFARKTPPTPGYTNDYNPNNSNTYNINRDEDKAANLMHEARPNGWSGTSSNYNDYDRPSVPSLSPTLSEGAPIDRDQAMDLFFQVQGAWANRDLSSAANLLDTEAKNFLEGELSRLKSLRQINRLENIAVRDVQAVESWRDMGKEFSTVRITANLLDFTIDETSFQVVSGSKTTPVKFEEYWTFARENGSPWKLSAIQQS